MHLFSSLSFFSLSQEEKREKKKKKGFCRAFLRESINLSCSSSLDFIIFSKMQVKESKWLVKCFLNYLRHEKTEVNVLFDILSIFLIHSRIDYTFLKEFYIIEVLILHTVINVLSYYYY